MWKSKTSILVSIFYLTGFVTIQLHSLEYGITDLEILNAYYFIVGFLYFFTLLPACLFVLSSETFIAITRSRKRKNYFRESKTFSLLATAFAILSAFILLRYFQTYQPWNRYFFFCTIGQPKAFVYTNYWTFNTLFILGYATLCADRRLNIVTKPEDDFGFAKSNFATLSSYWLRKGSKPFILKISIIFLTPYTIVFGSSIFPAINPSIGGGSPMPVEIQRKNNKAQQILMIAQRAKAVYGIQIPEGYPLYQEYFKNPQKQFMKNENHPLSQAIINNRIVYIPRSEIVNIKFKFPKLYRYQEHYYLKNKLRIEKRIWNYFREKFLNGA